MLSISFFILIELSSIQLRGGEQDVHAILPDTEKEQASCPSLPAPSIRRVSSLARRWKTAESFGA